MDGQVDIGLLLDSSGSIGFSQFESLKQFLIDFFSDAPLGADQTRLAGLSYSRESRIEWLFSDFLDKSDYKKKVLKQIKRIKYMSSLTNTTGALQVARNDLFNVNNGDRDEVPNLAMLFSDGNNNQENETLFKSARELKADGVYIAGIAIGKALQANPDEIRALASDASEVIFIKSFDDLIPLRKTIAKVMCEGSICYQEGREERRRCRFFRCEGGKWRRVGYTGCLMKGKCIKWGESYESDCDQYICRKGGECKGNICPNYDLQMTDNGCNVNGVCKRENVKYFNEEECTTYQCLNGEFTMVERDCEDNQGNCRKIGYRYTENCITRECMSVNEGEMVEFRAIDFGCSYKGKCIARGTAIKEKCNTLVCEFDDLTGIYDIVLDSQGCEDGGRCRTLNEEWKDDSTCTKYKCVYDDKNDRMKIRERSSGCKEGDDCIKKGEGTQKGCTKYVCQKNGEMQIESVGCEHNGVCRALNATWRVEGQCATYRCLQDYRVADAIITYVEEDLGKACHDIEGNCIKPGQTFVDNCKTYKCQDNGQNILTKSQCRHRDRCYNIGDEWVDKLRCKHLKCRKDKKLGAVLVRRKYGCVDEDKKCYTVDAFKQDDKSCVKYKCYDDHILRQESCEYKDKCYKIGANWIDNEDCIQLSCDRNDETGDASISSDYYGCFQDKVCRAPAYQYSQDCQTYECEGYGRGFKIINTACPWKKGCKNVNSTWFDNKTCRKYGCFEDDDGVDIAEITYGCQTDEKCIRSGKELDEGCIKYKCNNGKLEPTYIGCETDDGCMDLDKQVFDEVNCVKKKCVIDEQGDNFVSTKIKERWGCLEHGACYRGGEKKIEGCLTYQCKSRKRDFVLIEAGCEWRQNCYAVNSTWVHPKKCIRFTCVMDEETGLPRLRRKLFGCRDKNGHCHKFGHKKTIAPCVVSECQKKKGSGPAYYPVEVGCKRGKKCKPLDSTWIARRKCVRKTCLYEPGSYLPEKVATPYGCKDEMIAKGKCRPFGFKAFDDDNKCVQYECTPYETYAPIKMGCPWKDECKPDRAQWSDPDTCYSYRCERQNIGTSRVKMHMVTLPGCKDLNGNCVSSGTTIRDGCTVYVCDPSRGGLVKVSDGCMYKEECKAINSTWFDDEFCTDMVCNYNEDLDDLFIIEIEKGCKDVDGRCFEKGQRKKEGCNKFICNGKSNLMPKKMGCEWKGECKDIDSSWKVGCVTYTCRLEDKGPNYVKTRIDTVHGCVADGVCYDIGQTREEDCIRETCKEGGKFVMSAFGCRGWDGSCLEPGATASKGCVDYKCNPDTWSMEPFKRACVWRDGCKDVGSKWTERKTCKQYQCRYDLGTKDAEKVEITQGCKVDGKCKKEGSSLEIDCIKYTCDNGKMVTSSMGCAYNNKCYKIGDILYEGCDKWMCKLKNYGFDEVATAWDIERGCYDAHGKCYRAGEEFQEGCRKMMCRGGGKMDVIVDGCMSISGCVPVGSMVEDFFKGAFICGEGGELRPFNVTQVQGCDMEDAFYQLYESFTDDFCTKWECQTRDGETKFYPVEYGCMEKNGTCYKIGQDWHNDDDCNFFECIREVDKRGNVNGKIRAEYGCSYGGHCYHHNEKFKEESDCTTRKCVISKKNGVTLKEIKIVKGACIQKVGNANKCREVGEEWRTVRTLLCYDTKCFNRNGTYSIEIIGRECADTRQRCHTIGQSGFSAISDNGQEMDDCTCMAYEETGVKVHCNSIP
ncbi:hypothetical protein FSP39_021813 [Pinctada imbricata]|uniref:VWFA domain-containing protein n=1 Tax=Pinctada imbricata TaxID=66713 RepID=A0AA88XSF7_PINIB|nr:hypothetical protein FSP39_021813 [Pinctada imbricata]